MKTKLLTFLCLLLALQSALSNVVSGHNLRMLNAQQQQNVLVICTGTSTKWIDSQRYFETGQIIEVEQPSEVSSIDMNLACYNSILFEHNTAHDIVAKFLVSFLPLQEQVLPAFAHVTLSHANFLLPLLRAPPLISAFYIF